MHVDSRARSGPSPTFEVKGMFLMEAYLDLTGVPLAETKEMRAGVIPGTVDMSWTDDLTTAKRLSEAVDRAILYYHRSYDKARDNGGMPTEWQSIWEDGQAKQHYQLFEEIVARLEQRGVPYIILEATRSKSRHFNCPSATCRTTVDDFMSADAKSLAVFFDKAFVRHSGEARASIAELSG